MAKILEDYHHSYGPSEAKAYVKKNELYPEGKAFFRPVVQGFLKAEALDKKVLDVACGPGYWCCEAVEYGAKSVDGFDIQEDMVELAKKTTAQYSSVNICVGDVTAMPYDDNSFDAAISIYVTCNLSIEKLTRYFEELHRVLVPGGKALVHNLSNPIFEKLYLYDGDDEASVKESIDEVLQVQRGFSSLAEINNAFQKCGTVVRACFAKDENDLLFHVTNTNQLINGQTVWCKTERMTFPNYFYDEKYLTGEMVAAGFSINKVENPYTEERRVVYDRVNSGGKQLNKKFIEYPPTMMYHLQR